VVIEKFSPEGSFVMGVLLKGRRGNHPIGTLFLLGNSFVSHTSKLFSFCKRVVLILGKGCSLFVSKIH
jgi:hypothetical protein